MSITKKNSVVHIFETNMEHTSFPLTVSLLMTISHCIDYCVVFVLQLWSSFSKLFWFFKVLFISRQILE